MFKLFTPRKLFFLIGFAISLQTFAAYIDNGSGKKNKAEVNISLKNFRSNTYPSTAYPSFRLSQFQFTGSSTIYQKSTISSIEGQSYLRLENGNTSFVFPYKYKVKVPFFKVPSAPQAH